MQDKVKNEDMKCANCGRLLYDDGMDDDGDPNIMGLQFNIWCPDCGARARWYMGQYNSTTQAWPDKSKWDIPVMTRRD